MSLTPQQLAALKADVLADPALAPLAGSPDGRDAIRNAYNQAASPAYWAWRTRASKDELVTSVSVDGTTFSWTGTGFITRAQGERDAWRELFSGGGTVNPSLANVRQAFADIFSGNTAPAPANRTHLATVSRRAVTRAEKLFAVAAAGVGNDGVAANRGRTTNPDALTFEGAVTFADVDAALNLP